MSNMTIYNFHYFVINFGMANYSTSCDGYSEESAEIKKILAFLTYFLFYIPGPTCNKKLYLHTFGRATPLGLNIFMYFSYFH